MTHEIRQDFNVDINAQGRLVIYRGAHPLMTVYPRDWIIERVDRVQRRRFIAWDSFRERSRKRFQVTRALASSDGAIHLLDGASRELLWFRVRTEADGSLLIEAETKASDINRVGFRWWAPMAELLYGFGEYGNGPQNPATHWSTWVEEGPVGLGPLSSWLRWTGRVPLPNGYRSTYAPMPSWLSSLGYAAWLDNTERIDWTVLGARRSLRVWGRRVVLHLVAGRDWKELLARRAERLGRPPLAPPWVLLPWIDAVRGEERVRQVAERLRREKVPASAIWVEDWMGSWEDARRFWMRPLSHQVNDALYPDLGRLARHLHSLGFKFLGYFCPEIAVDTPLYREALSEGHLVRNAAGRPLIVNILGNLHGEPDLTQAKTRRWIQERWLAPLEALGMDGWMADFGEYLPVDAVLGDGTDGWTSHNRYPVLWQKTHREFWDRKRPDGDYTFFVRSAGLCTPTITPVMWGGDSDTDWDRADGLASVVPAALSASVSGQALWATDIAGYMTFGLTRPSGKELYLRWAELAALLPVMRTHHGTALPRNWSWDRDDETLALFARAARLHALLFPYLFTLVHEAHETGFPLVRPLFFEDSDPSLARITDQFMLGPDLLVAPVVTRGARARKVVFPAGWWCHWWTQGVWQGPGVVEVPAPLGEPPLFVRKGTGIPLLEGPCEPDGVPLGFVQTVGAGAAAHPADQHVTVLDTGCQQATTNVRMPRGRLSLAILDARGELQDFLRTPSPRYVDHAPFLGTEAPSVWLKPRQSSLLAGLTCHWDGDEPIRLTYRHGPWRLDR